MMLIDNRNYLRIHHRSILEKLRHLEETEQNDRVTVEPSKKGAPTIKIMAGHKVQYVHSKYDPENEAEKLIAQIERLDEYNHVLFIGTGLGYHIKEFLMKRPDISFSIYEPDLEMLSQFLSFQDIMQLSQKAKLEKIIITKNENEIQEEVKSLHTSSDKKILVYTLPSCAKIYEQEEIVIMQTLKNLLKDKRSNLVTNFSFQKRWTINSIKNFPEILQTPNILHDIEKKAFKGKPAIIVAAGPALNEEFENLKYIKENGLAYIFSVGSAINPLIEQGIYPDAACTYDPTERNHLVFEKLKEQNITNIPLIFGSSVGFETVENYPGTKLHMLTNQDTIAPYFINNAENINVVLDAPSIAVVTLQLLALLGCSPIILVGQNLAFQNNNRYATGINYNFVNNELSEQEKENLLIVKDVYGNDIQTDESFNRMRKQMERYISLCQDIEVINTSKGGAQIEGTVFFPLSAVITNKIPDTKIVSANWFVGRNSYDLNYAKDQLINIREEKLKLEKFIISAIKILREINGAVNTNQIKDLEKKFTQLDKNVSKLQNNSFFKVFIEPMIRVHNNRLSEEIPKVRFETNLIKKGQAVANLFAGFLMDCQAHITFLNSYVKELEDNIQNFNEMKNKN